MKEEIKKVHGHQKTNDVFAFDEGVSEQQGPFITVARPIRSDPDVIRKMLEDALIMQGDANARLNIWRQRRLSDFLTDLRKRNLREGIPTD